MEQFANSEIAPLMFAGAIEPTAHKMSFTMSTELSNAIESHINGTGDRKVFNHLNIKRHGYKHGWVGAVNAHDLADFFVNSRKKSSAQYYSRILVSLREKKIVFSIWINKNRSIKAHLNFIWLCLDPSQWDDIFKGCPIYPITLSRFFNSLDSLDGAVRSEFRKLKINSEITLDYLRKEMIKVAFAQFIPKMHPDVVKSIPIYDSKTDPKMYLFELDNILKKWPARYGIENSKFQGSEDLIKRITDFARNNEDVDFEDHIFGNEIVDSSGVHNSTTEVELAYVSGVHNSTTELVSSVHNSTTETQKNVIVTNSNSNELQSPSCARDKEFKSNQELTEKKEEIIKEKRGNSSSNSENKTDNSKNISKHCINREEIKKRHKMISNDCVIREPGQGSGAWKNENKKSVQRQSKSSFDLASPRQYDIKTPTGLYNAIKNEMFKRHSFRFNGKFEVNIRNEKLVRTMDDIREAGCLDDEILTEWVSWFSNVYMTHEKLEKPSSKFISTFTDTWKAFRKTISRPEERDAKRREVMSHKISESSSNEIGNHLERIMQKTKNNSEAITAMLLQFGVVVVGNWIEIKLKKSDARLEIKNALDSMGRMQLIHVYGMTVMRESQFVTSGTVPFSDWRIMYKDFFEGIEDEDDIKPVDYECDEVDRFLTNLTR